MDLFGATSEQQNTSQQPVADLFSPAAPAPATSAPESNGLRVPGISHGGLSVEFICTKPESWNNQKSTLIAQFNNSTGAPITEDTDCCSKHVTDGPTLFIFSKWWQRACYQKINTNALLGTKNLMMKLSLALHQMVKDGSHGDVFSIPSRPVLATVNEASCPVK
jgi:AP-1 complex subunit gamma-1